jgi:hypothetical protein
MQLLAAHEYQIYSLVVRVSLISVRHPGRFSGCLKVNAAIYGFQYFPPPALNRAPRRVPVVC